MNTKVSVPTPLDFTECDERGVARGAGSAPHSAASGREDAP